MEPGNDKKPPVRTTRQRGAMNRARMCRAATGLDRSCPRAHFFHLQLLRLTIRCNAE